MPASDLKCEIIPVTPFQQNCSLIWEESSKKAALVDAGGDVDKLIERLEHHGLILEKLFVTHGHLDHASGVADLAEKFGVPIEGPHEEDQFWIDGIEEQGKQFGFKSGRSFTPDRWLNQGDAVEFGSTRFDVHHCPGHTPGHVVFVQTDLKLAFVGDVLFQGSIGRTDFPKGNHAHLIKSIRERLFPLGDDIRFVPGHGPMSTFGQERQNNPFVSDASVGQ